MEARIDYLKLAYPGPVDHMAAYRSMAFIQAELAEGHMGKEYSISASWVGQESRQYLHFLELWGWTAENFTNANWQVIFGAPGIRVLRMDYRVEGVEEGKLATLLDVIPTNKQARFQTFRSRERNKKGDRDGGGSGVAVGSHKSDSRLICYRRGKEPAAAEVMLRGKQLDGVLAPARVAYGEYRKTGDIAFYDQAKALARTGLATYLDDRIDRSYGPGTSGWLLWGGLMPVPIEEGIIEQAESLLAHVQVNLHGLLFPSEDLGDLLP